MSCPTGNSKQAAEESGTPAIVNPAQPNRPLSTAEIIAGLKISSTSRMGFARVPEEVTNRLIDHGAETYSDTTLTFDVDYLIEVLEEAEQERGLDKREQMGLDAARAAKQMGLDTLEFVDYPGGKGQISSVSERCSIHVPKGVVDEFFDLAESISDDRGDFSVDIIIGFDADADGPLSDLQQIGVAAARLAKANGKDMVTLIDA